MPFTENLVAELNVLVRFNLTTTLEGIKIHKTANPEVIAAAHRLYQKGLITQEDGGYLTSLGRETAEQIQSVLTILNSL